jgi:hypothetical protein
MKNTNEVKKWDALQYNLHSGDFARRLGNDTTHVIDVCSLIDSNAGVTFIRRFLGLVLLYSSQNNWGWFPQGFNMYSEQKDLEV